MAPVSVGLYIGTGLLDVAPTRLSVVQGAGLDVMQLRAAPARGPRRLAKDVVERYDRDPRRLLAVKPDLSGLRQVSGCSDLTWAESARLDVKYVDNWSLILGLSILCRTLGADLNHRGAY